MTLVTAAVHPYGGTAPDEGHLHSLPKGSTMRARRTSLLATSVALAMLAVTAGGATAAEGDDIATDVVTVQRDTEAPVVPAQPGTSLDDLTRAGDRSSTLQVATGTAATLLTAINAHRANAGLPGLVEDDAINAVATSWSIYSANNQVSDNNPNLEGQLPGYWWDASEVVLEIPPSWVEAGGWEIAQEVINDPELGPILMDPNPTHVGIGWAGDSEGWVYATIDLVEYDFYDVGPSHSFHTDVVWLLDAGVTTGYADRTFRPTSGVSRQAMAAFLYRWLNEGAADPTCDPSVARTFSDVPASHDFCGVIEWLADSGITGGYEDGTFRPTNPVTRQAVSAFVYRSLEGAEADATCTDGARRFNDVTTANAFCGEIEWLAGTNITAGYADGGFHPGWGMSRQAMARFLLKATEYAVSQS